MNKIFSLLIILLGSLQTVSATPGSITKAINAQLKSEYGAEKPLPSFRITSTVPLKAEGIMVAYGVQTYQGFDVHKAVFTAIFQSHELISLKHSLVPHLDNLVPSHTFGLSPLQALSKIVGQQAGVAQQGALEDLGNGFYEVIDKKLSDETIKIQKMWVLVGKVVVPAYSISLYEKNHEHWFDTRIDATAGKTLNYDDWVVQCQGGIVKDNISLPFAPMQSDVSSSMTAHSGASYTVFDRPIESPIHGARTTVVDPHDSSASPYGWHDTNGADGAEFTITRGNNVYASEDKNNDNITGSSPDGGTNLTFTYAFDINKSAETVTVAAKTTLCVCNN